MIGKILSQITYGMYIVSSIRDGKYNGQIVNSISQITNDPPTLMISINKNNLTHDYILESGCFSLSILDKQTPLTLIGDFGFHSGRDKNKFEKVKHEILDSGCPVVTEHTLGCVDGKVINQMDCGTYTLFLAEIVQGKFLSEGEPMTYDYYHKEKCGTTPESAPTYLAENDDKIECENAPKYRCTVCNYIFNPVKGDPDSGIMPGTPFADIPDNWVCPICGVGKDKFVKQEG